MTQPHVTGFLAGIGTGWTARAVAVDTMLA
ncbi:hypothetical protein J2S42_006785 [Catenuloplanes indicus]|uniref:Uncharacterized protein n=1 Tax=Catenuloplanes indicus TaxID=137267 RepID=A0AAE3W5T5_9ACTN|nr:hypothetical protein [Catenuloplanes indicus]